MENQKIKFIKEWKNFDELNKKMQKKIFKFFSTGNYMYQLKHDEPKKKFKPYSFTQIDNILGLAYTSTGAFAALWICNGVNLFADNERKFYGFAIDTKNNFYALAEDENEKNELIILM